MFNGKTIEKQKKTKQQMEKTAPKVPKDSFKIAPWVPNWVPREARSPGFPNGFPKQRKTIEKQ